MFTSGETSRTRFCTFGAPKIVIHTCNCKRVNSRVVIVPLSCRDPRPWCRACAWCVYMHAFALTLSMIFWLSYWSSLSHHCFALLARLRLHVARLKIEIKELAEVKKILWRRDPPLYFPLRLLLPYRYITWDSSNHSRPQAAPAGDENIGNPRRRKK